jgi:hypothetical protein
VHGATGDLHPVVEGLLLDVHAGEGGQQGGVDVDHAVGERRAGTRGEQAHEARQHHQLHAMLAQLRQQRAVELRAGGEGPVIEHGADDAGLLCAGERPHPATFATTTTRRAGPSSPRAGGVDEA